MTLKAVTNQPVQLYAAPAYGQPGITFRVTNLDEVSTVWVDTDTTITASSTPLPPQASAVYDGSTDVWASTLSQNLIVAVDFAPGSLYYDNPVGVQIALNALGLATASNQVTQTGAINAPAYGPSTLTEQLTQTGAINAPAYGPSTLAQQVTQQTQIPLNMKASGQGVTTEIAAYLASGSPTGTPGGVPLLTYRNSLVSQTSVALANATTVSFPSSGTLPVTQIGYDGLIELQAAGATTLLVNCEIIVTWYDSGTVIDSQVYNVYAGQASTTPHSIYIKGPTRGTEFSISFTNNSGTAITITSCQIFQNSRVYTCDLWRTITGVFMCGTSATLSIAGYETSGNFIGVENGVAVAAGVTEAYVLPLYTGRVSIVGGTTSDTSDMQLYLSNSISPAAVQGILFDSFSDGVGIIVPTVWGMPRDQCTLNLRNTNAAGKNLSAAILGLDY